MLLWGCRGKGGNEPLHYRPIRIISREHLGDFAIIALIGGLRCEEW